MALLGLMGIQVFWAGPKIHMQVGGAQTHVLPQ